MPKKALMQCQNSKSNELNGRTYFCKRCFDLKIRRNSDLLGSDYIRCLCHLDIYLEHFKTLSHQYFQGLRPRNIILKKVIHPTSWPHGQVVHFKKFKKLRKYWFKSNLCSSYPSLVGYMCKLHISYNTCSHAIALRQQPTWWRRHRSMYLARYPVHVLSCTGKLNATTRRCWCNMMVITWFW